MYRILFFIATLFFPIIFGWWLFVPMATIFVYLAKLPYEIIVIGAILDSAYYFGDSLLEKNMFTVFAAILIIAAVFLSRIIDWHKSI